MDTLRGHLCVDIETTSGCDLKEAGAWAYSMHDSTRVYCVALRYFERDAGVQHNAILWEPGDPVPFEVIDYTRAGGLWLAHNAAFERAIFENLLGPKHGWPVPTLPQWRDTQPLGLALSLPPTLDGLAKALGCPAQKDKEGAALMKKMAKAKAAAGGGWDYPHNTPENRGRLASYCIDDVDATIACFLRLPPLSVFEHQVWMLDQQINHRGVYVDRQFAARCLTIANERKQSLALETFRLTCGELASATSPQQLKAWVKGHGVKLPRVPRKQSDGSFKASETLDAAARKKLLQDPELPEIVRQVLNVRAEAGKLTSLGKLQRVEKMVDPRDGRLRNALHYHAAHTGRWTSSGLQIHNLPKIKLSEEAYELAMLLVERGKLSELLLFEDRPLEILSQLLRSVIAAPPGRELIAADFAAIEARVIPWLAGDEDLLHVFASGQDVYVYTAQGFGAVCETHGRHVSGCPECDRIRQLGKVVRLACNYGMGAVKLADTGGQAGVDLPLKEWRTVHKGFRESNPLITGFWHDLENAFRLAVQHPGRRYAVGRLAVQQVQDCVCIVLPSGRSLRYWKPRIANVTKRIETIDEDGTIVTREFEAEELQFFSVGPNKVSMTREATYGGKLAENVTQAAARDVLAASLLGTARVEPYTQPVMHVHDSIAVEVAEGAGDVDEFCRIARGAAPGWAAGLPIALDGYRGPRFRG